MATHYEIWLEDPYGNPLKVLNSFIRLEVGLKANDVGVLTLTLPPDLFPYCAIDGRVKVWRAAEGGPLKLVGDKAWLIRKRVRSISQSGVYSLTLTCPDINVLLKRRNVAYSASSAQAKKTAAADDMMKAIVRENLGSLATDTNRSVASYVSVQPDLGLGPTITKAFSHRPVLAVLQELAQASATAGNPIYFDIVSTGSGYEFRTFKGQRNNDHRFPGGNNPVRLGPDFGNVVEAALTEDWQDEANFIYAGGQGEADDRTIITAQDDSRIGISPFGRVEYFQDARNTGDSSTLGDEAKSALWDHRPKIVFAGKLQDTNGTRFGREYDFGDQLTVQMLGYSLDVRLDVAKITVDGGKETLDAPLQSVV